MTTSFQDLLTACLVALGDRLASTWSRTDVIWPWCLEAMTQFPILRPQRSQVTFLARVYENPLPADFREIISVEYPVGKLPPVYLVRMNRFDPSYYETDDHYDIDRAYLSGTGWTIWFSHHMESGEIVNINYLANHDIDMEDDPACYITVPDEYVNILVQYVVCKGYRERLGAYMQDPTAHTSIITQMYEMVEHAETKYKAMVDDAMKKYVESRRSPHMQLDKFDRIY